MNDVSSPVVGKEKSEGDARHFFTPGPASLSAYNFEGLSTCFGRGDEVYAKLESRVLDGVREFAGQSKIVRLQGAASLSLEIVSLNFLYGEVVIVDTGYYSSRLASLANFAKSTTGQISRIRMVPWTELDSYSASADWVWACSVETSVGLKVDIRELERFCSRIGAFLALDATASIGLEDHHELAEVTSFSSCKGLFGLTGAAFVCYNNEPRNEVLSFNLSLGNHLQKQMTGPYHAIQSLDFIIPNHDDLKHSVLVNKKAFLRRMKHYLTVPKPNQPLLCTQVSAKVRSKSGRSILYTPRGNNSGSVVCHLGEVHLGASATGASLDDLEVVV
jgi:2-aminoethylphosphonate-pyruvate transaminase